MSKVNAILYVEDDAASREIMQLLVNEVMGIKDLLIFEDSYHFLDKVRSIEPKPDIILLDIHVPPMNGFEMLMLLRTESRFANTPIVALTASVMNEEVARLREAGFNGVIPKPLNMDSFPMLLDRVMQGEEVWNIIE
jgi:two-component system, cell cycle response regulator DivK